MFCKLFDTSLTSLYCFLRLQKARLENSDLLRTLRLFKPLLLLFYLWLLPKKCLFLLLHPLQCFKQPVPGFPFALPSVQLINSLLKCICLRSLLSLECISLLKHPSKHPNCFFVRNHRICPILLPLLPGRFVSDIFNAVHLPPCILLVVLQRPIQPSRTLFQFLLNTIVQSGLEDLREDLLALSGFRVEKPQEISLSDHSDLGKLRRIHPHDLCNLLIRLPLLPPVCASVRQDQLYPGGFLHVSGRPVCIASLPQAQIFRIAPDGITLLSIRECILHIGIHILRRVLAAHHVAVSLPAAGLVIQGINDRIK